MGLHEAEQDSQPGAGRTEAPPSAVFASSSMGRLIASQSRACRVPCLTLSLGQTLQSFGVNRFAGGARPISPLRPGPP